MIKFTKRETEDFLTLIRHARIDISYQEGGSYNDGDDNVDKKEVEKSARAIERLKVLMVNGA